MIRRSKGVAYVCLCFAVLITLPPTYGQVPTGSIAGTVVDPAGLAIARSDVTVINQGTGTEYKTTTSPLGAFRVSSLQAGLYKVRVSSSGFKAYELADIKLDAGTERSLPPLNLEVGTVTQTVAVEAGFENVQTTTASIGTTIERKQIESLPILDRNPVNLVGLIAGVNQNGRSNTTINGTPYNVGMSSVNGATLQTSDLAGTTPLSPPLPTGGISKILST